MKGCVAMNTLAEIELCDKEMLLPTDIAGVLDCDAHSIRLQARDDPKQLGFPVVVVGTRIKIPREGFLKFMRGELRTSTQQEEHKK